MRNRPRSGRSETERGTSRHDDASRKLYACLYWARSCRPFPQNRDNILRDIVAMGKGEVCAVASCQGEAAGTLASIGLLQARRAR